MQWEMPEPYASMSATDPRRREYIEQLQAAEATRRAAIEDFAREIHDAWAAGRPRLHIAVPAVVTSPKLDVDAPTELTVAGDVASVLSEAEQVGWDVDQVDYVYVPGADVALAAGVRLQRGTVIAMVNLRRPATPR